MGSIWGILVVVAGLVVSVGLHELGHMIPAKRFGALVPEYAIGFGPALARWRRGGTDYVLRALPLGGYVRILGMFAPGSPDRRRSTRSGRPTLAEEARLASAGEVPAGLEERAFHALAWWRKAVVMASGPLVNLVLAFVLLAASMVGVGAPTPSPLLAEVPATVMTPSGEVPGPAASAGLRAGDRIVSVAGTPIREWRDIGAALSSADAGSVEVEAVRGDERIALSIDAVDNGSGSRLIGVVGSVDYRSASLSQVVSAYGAVLSGTASALARLPVAVWDVGRALFTGAERDANGLVSVVGIGRIAGEVTGDSASLGIDSARQSWGILLSLLASLNAALGLFNLIPLPPLDGGHIAGALVEGARSVIARLRGRTDPGAVDTARLMPLTYLVGGLLAAMTLLLVIADIIRPIALG